MHDVVFDVVYVFREATHTVPVSVPVNLQDVKPTVIQTVSKTSPGALPHSFDGFVLLTVEGKQIVQAATIRPGETLQFFSPDVLEPVSSSQWTMGLLQQLKIRTEHLAAHEFLQKFGIDNATKLPDTALLLLNSLKSLSHETISNFRDEGDQALLRSEEENTALYKMSIVKFLYLIEKYPKLEAAVDSFVLRVLIALGYEDGMMVAVPQFRLKLPWGVTVKESIADFTIMDVLSFLKIFIVEDKNLSVMRMDSTPQMFGEAVAVNATNRAIHSQEPARKKSAVGDFQKPAATPAPAQESPAPLLGVRVNGTRFFFYSITVTERIETAMESRTPPAEETVMYGAGDGAGYDFLIEKDRKVIITILSLMYAHISAAGASEVHYSLCE